MAQVVYNTFLAKLANGEFDWEAADVRLLLLKGTGYTADPTHDFVADLTPASNECTATNYARQALASQSVTLNDTDDRAQLTHGDVTFTDLGSGDSPQEVIQAGVYFVQVTNDADSYLIKYDDSISGTLNGNTAVVQSPATGTIRIRQAV